VRNLARDHTTLAVETLVEICQHGESEAARIGAAVALLDRAWGKPTVAVELHEPAPDIGALVLEAHRKTTIALSMPVAIEMVRDDMAEAGFDHGRWHEING
jgi:hypothetical protein